MEAPLRSQNSDGKIASFLFPLIIRSVVEPDVANIIAERLGFDLTQMAHSRYFVAAPDGPRSMWGELLRVTGNPHIGWDAGGLVELSALGPFYKLLASAATVGSALRAAVKYGDVLETIRTPLMRVNGDTFSFIWKSNTVATRQQDTDFRIRLGYRIIRAIAPDCRLIRVHVPYQPARALQEKYREVLQCDLVFDSDRIEGVFDAEMLEQPLPTADEFLHDIAASRNESLRPKRPSDGQRALIENAYDAAVAVNKDSFDELAERLGMTGSAFRDKLRSLSTLHRDECQKARVRRAEWLLVYSDKQLEEIAKELGYANAPAFSRAFRRWTGMPPGRYRRARAQAL